MIDSTSYSLALFPRRSFYSQYKCCRFIGTYYIVQHLQHCCLPVLHIAALIKRPTRRCLGYLGRRIRKYWSQHLPREMVSLSMRCCGALGATAALMLSSQRAGAFTVRPSSGNFGRLQPSRYHRSRGIGGNVENARHREDCAIPCEKRLGGFGSPWKSSQELNSLSSSVAEDQARKHVQVRSSTTCFCTVSQLLTQM